MKNKLLSLHNKILNFSSVKLVICMFFMIILIQIIITPFYKMFPSGIYVGEIEELNNMLFDNNNFGWTLFNFGILAPLWETLIFQTLIIKVVWVCMRKFFNNKSFITNVIPIIISSLFFGAAHYVTYLSFVKLINTFLLGSVLAYTYVVAYSSRKKASLCVMSVHSIWNVFSTAISYIVYI